MAGHCFFDSFWLANHRGLNPLFFIPILDLYRDSAIKKTVDWPVQAMPTDPWKKNRYYCRAPPPLAAPVRWTAIEISKQSPVDISFAASWAQLIASPAPDGWSLSDSVYECGWGWGSPHLKTNFMLCFAWHWPLWAHSVFFRYCFKCQIYNREYEMFKT